MPNGIKGKKQIQSHTRVTLEVYPANGWGQGELTFLHTILISPKFPQWTYIIFVIIKTAMKVISSTTWPGLKCSLQFLPFYLYESWTPPPGRHPGALDTEWL